jgi:transposase
MREVINGIIYVLSTGCRWRTIPKDLPPRSTLFDYFTLWNDDGTLDRIHRALYAQEQHQDPVRKPWSELQSFTEREAS